MKSLSVVIVNYNVRFFLEQCLESVYSSYTTASSGDFRIDVTVVDNNSVDDSLTMLSQRFPQVKVIANKENVGFAKANNQALKQATGDYILLLNPDTLVETTTFSTCIDFLDQHPECGALGVKMVDGKGNYLPESKRGFPTPATSFYKLSGLIKLFPHSRKIGAYYMGHLPDNEINSVEILSGAFIMTTREALDKVGLLDESYFMYAEDIDFSWRFILAGYKNYYLPTTRIIHYKGESTKKGSINYVYTFYNAMAIFSKKYFSGKYARLFNALIHLAIWCRASLSFLKRLLKGVALPCLDLLVAFAGFLALKQVWAVHHLNVNYYPDEYSYVILPLYVLVMMVTAFFYGGYDKPLKIGRLLKGMTLGAVVLLIFYSMLDESRRYSRAILLLGSLWTIISSAGIRGILSLMGLDGYTIGAKKKRATIIVGSDEECTRVANLYNDLKLAPKQMVPLMVSNKHQLADMVSFYKAEEVIFCSRDITTADIISLMTNAQLKNVDYKIIAEGNDYLVGANSITSRADIYAEELNSITSATNSRFKRLIDILMSLLFIILSPLMILFQKRKKDYFPDTYSVLIGKRTWVGYAAKQGIFSPADMVGVVNRQDKEMIELRYARNYHITTDLAIIWKNILNI